MRPKASRITQANGVTSAVEKQPLKWIAEQFPNSPDVFIDELPLLDQDVNTMKERVGDTEPSGLGSAASRLADNS